MTSSENMARYLEHLQDCDACRQHEPDLCPEGVQIAQVLAPLSIDFLAWSLTGIEPAHVGFIPTPAVDQDDADPGQELAQRAMQLLHHAQRIMPQRCTWCGNQALPEQPEKYVHQYRVACSCGAAGPWRTSLADAVEAWNVQVRTMTMVVAFLRL